ncbi:hypothetical protein CHN50_11015 [Priestia aryabhattai]|uniref:IDEAL domain-containing protein n=1 Tax=Bacillaceae TaxID=186817 RepID=UPI000BA012F5|nr:MULTISPECIES: IDEAL domain-containing protein [Bacillaceae]MDT2047538.1 IDEAL domain-containing protein [Priestia flexa]OZT12433.1 hypothetical protein CHN50_11015 [Priestia aryabhattai]TDB55278.1 IDEAL domain-containing protein [Bacillus sp. CBEL-1]USY56342.1 IDEAL domain-containing protein [Bacillus sp. 1780r2a1]
MNDYRKNKNFATSTSFRPVQTYYSKEASHLLKKLSTDFNKKHVKELIDEALDKKDEKLFYKLTARYSHLL